MARVIESPPLQLARECRPGAKETGLHGALGAAEHECDLADGPFLVVIEHQRAAQPLRQAIDQRSQLLRLGLRYRFRVPVRVSRELVDVRVGCALAR